MHHAEHMPHRHTAPRVRLHFTILSGRMGKEKNISLYTSHAGMRDTHRTSRVKREKTRLEFVMSHRMRHMEDRHDRFLLSRRNNDMAEVVVVMQNRV